MTGLAQKFVAILLGIVSSFALLVMYWYPSRTVFFSVCGAWVVLTMMCVYAFRRVQEQANEIVPLLLATMTACTALSLILEWRWWNLFLVVFIGIAVALLFGWSAIEHVGISSIQKPFRRMKMMLWVFDVYGCITALFSFVVFFPNVQPWVFQLAGGLIFAGASFMIWRMYYEAGVKQLVIWLLMVGSIMVEVLWALQLLPFGYLVSGVLATWIWYILQLLTRFHIGVEDVVWRRQRGFLITNAILFALTMYVARWV